VRSVENAECGKCGVWKMRSVENAECGKCGVWKMRSVENAECRKCRVWKMRSVENAECGKLNNFIFSLKCALERFSIECRKTKTKVITLANHKGHR